MKTGQDIVSACSGHDVQELVIADGYGQVGERPKSAAEAVLRALEHDYYMR